MEGDEVVFERSVRNNEEPVLFSEKKYNFIVDSTSNQGNFSSGQMQFNLKTLSSQSQWTSLSEMVVEFPIKITAQVTTAAVNGTGGSPVIANGAFAGLDSALIKSGFHQWINSAQLIINGQTIQSLQQYENVAATYRILSSWSQDNLKTWGTTTGIALDDMTGDSTGTTATMDTVGISNAPIATVCDSIRGFDCVNNQAVLSNRGVVSRTKLNNNAITTSTVAGGILGTAQMINSGMSNVSTFASATSVTAANQYIYVQYMMGTVRIRDLFDIEEFPLVKNIDGYLYLNFNSATTTLTGALNGSYNLANALASTSTTMNNGLSCPYLLNVSNSIGSNTATNGINFEATSGATGGTPSAAIITVIGNVDGTKTTVASMVGGTAGAPLITQARLIAPFYVANPQVDAALTKHNHSFSTYEKIVNPITVTAGGSTNYIVTVGVPNPRKLVLLPMWQNLNAGSATAGWGKTGLTSPEISPFDSVPATSGPYAYLSQLQVYVANKPLFQYPINYDFEMWNAEISQLGANGNVVDELTSGLLTQQLWEQNHRYYCIDLERRMESEDGASKSIQVSFTNPSPSTGYGLKVIAMVFYEKKWHIDSDICKLSSYA